MTVVVAEVASSPLKRFSGELLEGDEARDGGNGSRPEKHLGVNPAAFG
jgi:hypothetical protein